MIGAGTFISPLIKIITTVAILAAVYFFIVKPVLETTESTIDRSFESFEVFDDLQPDVQQSIRKAERLQEQQQAASAARIEEANRLLDCITEAGSDTARIGRCNQRFDPANP
jgi:F0F1-type ATP synthase membrane subunit b/b'